MTRLSPFAAIFLLSACTQEEAAPAPVPAPVIPPPPTCTFTAETAGVAVAWKAFKFTEKTGVGGGFSSATIIGAKPANETHKALDGLSFEIATAAVDSKNPERDQKIREQFFGTMADTAVLKGGLTVSSPDSGSLSVTLNGVTQAVPVKLQEGADGSWTVSGTIDLNTFNATAALDALNKVCSDLHKGTDGLSKLWPDVEISATVPVKKDCQPAK